MATSLSSIDDENRVRELTALKLLEIDSDTEFDSLAQRIQQCLSTSWIHD